MIGEHLPAMEATLVHCQPFFQSRMRIVLEIGEGHFAQEQDFVLDVGGGDLRVGKPLVGKLEGFGEVLFEIVAVSQRPQEPARQEEVAPLHIHSRIAEGPVPVPPQFHRQDEEERRKPGSSGDVIGRQQY